MGLRINTQRNLPIGVDLGSGSLKMAQLRTARDGLELLAMGSAEIPNDGQKGRSRRLGHLSRAIRGILKSGGFAGRRAVLSLPASAVFLQPVKIPPVPRAELDDTVANELQGKLPYPVDEAVIRHIPAGTVYAEGKEMQERIVAAISRSELSAHLAMARSAGLDVVGVNIEACALVECFTRLFRRRDDQATTTLFIDIGARSTQVVLARGANIFFARNLPVGGQTLDETVAEALQIPLEKAHRVCSQMIGDQKDPAAEEELYRLLSGKIAEIADQIAHCLRYCESSFGNHSVERIVFVGGQANNKRFCQSIAERLNLPAQIGNPMAGVRRLDVRPNDVDPQQPQPSWAVAIGLSLGAPHAA